jgi:hypothetical protein
MNDINWCFSDGPNIDIWDFIEKVQIHNENNSIENWNFNEIAINISQVKIQYSYWDRKKEQDVTEIFLLNANNKSYFTKGEPLFQIHNCIENNLAENREEYIFFGGLILCNGEIDNIPVYELILKS